MKKTLMVVIAASLFVVAPALADSKADKEKAEKDKAEKVERQKAEARAKAEAARAEREKAAAAARERMENRKAEMKERADRGRHHGREDEARQARQATNPATQATGATPAGPAPLSKPTASKAATAATQSSGSGAPSSAASAAPAVVPAAMAPVAAAQTDPALPGVPASVRAGPKPLELPGGPPKPKNVTLWEPACDPTNKTLTFKVTWDPATYNGQPWVRYQVAGTGCAAPTHFGCCEARVSNCPPGGAHYAIVRADYNEVQPYVLSESVQSRGYGMCR